ncbi:hypothetical protein GCK72_023134 [Caenorhabditis remanei]|uniref:Receptor L-domain domain-containing protein n=1 Tax=Caenorhabditis remanei TaxID=31234 RepID=A0A6A5FVU3_CAERE|nr:hypothetical protein GCK72_023134 [Caenorhabditis remanei]KAF1746677.1 hypothetical protein GCK72_023134 [Caenorhabditis remanei]
MLFGNVTINNQSELLILKEKMANVTRINGGLSVINTSFVDLSFLSSVEIIELNPLKSKYLASVNIQNNRNLSSLGFNAKRDGLYLTIRNNPKLCVTPQELDNLFYGISLDSDLDIDICYNNKTPSYWCDVSKFAGLKDLPDGCSDMTGDLVIDQDFDYASAYKLYGLRNIYGSLTITNSSIRKTSMFPNLHNIRSVKDDRIPLHVYNNSNLSDLFKMSQLRGMESGLAATIEDNPNLETWQLTCVVMKTRKSPVVKKNLNNCGEQTSTVVKRYDKTPLNVDVYHGLPSYPDVSIGGDSHEDPGKLNNPWDLNGTDSTDVDYVATTENNSFALKTVYLICLIIFVYLYHDS